MPTETTETLVKWLRNAPSTQWTATKLDRAADAIERLTARVRHLEDALTARFNADFADQEHYQNWRKENNRCN